jgi:predicted NBD/HSP70 family sugar kinase
MQCYDAGEAWAVRLGQMVARGMGIFLANIQSLLHLPLVVWKGTFGLEVMKRLEPAIRKAMDAVAVDSSWVSRRALRFLASPAPKDDQLVGAAKCFEDLRRPAR